MRVITALACLITLLAMPCASASEDLFGDMSSAMDGYNEQIDKLPSFLKHIGDERINCEIQLEGGGSMTVGVIIDNLQIDLQKGALDHPSVTVQVDEQTVREIINSGSPLTTIAAALEDGRITYRVHGRWWKKFKYSILERLLIERY
ncbi:MAG: conserved hypothetical protein, secreted [Candidatus Syntrophoarchaeum caldarius]|uniref:SCP2 domain-containing protein n=1 Tax=Candidatus Syntropharchaeum caldarium TaxID=1838285 RepID=A0A1F2PAY9_9EURY|nr:MAG: conserved hypothetical protein, secreted [Candidatus Syntrophoarchaeum caldarius]